MNFRDKEQINVQLIKKEGRKSWLQNHFVQPHRIFVY